ncbi:MAG: hypothetical protein U0636_03215 [Phycisphaerales bacterium]
MRTISKPAAVDVLRADRRLAVALILVGTEPDPHPLDLPAATSHELSSQRADLSYTKTQLIEAILEVNATASREWLMDFDFSALRRYWQRLQHALAPRGTTWEHPPRAA